MESLKAKITVLTPVYNREDCIGRCIESVMKQANFYHVVVNDGSTDNTSVEINKLKQKYKTRIEYVEYEKNKGKNYALNRGIEIINDGYILFLDSDDFLLDNATQVITNYIRNFPGYKHYMFIPNDRKEIIENNPTLKGKVNEVQYKDWINERVSGDFVHVIHSEVLKKFPFFEEFRLYEFLNFLRFYKYSQKQLIIKEVVVARERDRKDALTNEGKLFKKNAIELEYNFINKLFEYFEDDYKTIAVQRYYKYLKKYLILGLSLEKYNDLNKYNKQFNIIYRAIFNLKLGKLLKPIIRSYSFLKDKF